MNTLTLTPEVIEYAKKEVDIVQFYEASEICTAQDILYDDFIKNTKWKGLPKVIFYILLGEAYGQPFEKNANGLLGFKIKRREI